jgi:hypothetical protein
MDFAKLRTAGGVALAGAAGLATYAFLIRPWHLRWGATDAEVAAALPGDERVPDPEMTSTRAITIAAPADYIWPWIAQIGQTRGGFYSYTWLENAVGCRMRNADWVHPEWQDVEVGDEVWLHPKAPPLEVALVEPGRALVLGDDWAFVLEAVNDRTSRLIVRGRGRFTMPDLGKVGNFLYWRGVFEPAHFVMERKMMLEIKRRAEALYAAAAASRRLEARAL